MDDVSTSPIQPSSGKPTRPGQAKRIVPANPTIAAIITLAFTALLYLVEFADMVLPMRLDDGGIQSRTLSGLDGVLWAPLLHAGWPHLVSNTIPILVLGFLAMASGLGQWIAVTATVWILGGLGVWLIGPPAPATTIGASGLAFGWLAFLLVRGLFNRSFGQLAVAAVLLVVWGGMLWGVLPGNAGVSWQGHLCGALAGVLAAWLAAKADRTRTRKKPSGGVPGTSMPGNLGA